MTYLVILACLIAALLQWAIVRDRNIPEPDLVVAFRYLRIAGHAIAALFLAVTLFQGYWVPVPLALSIALLAIADNAGAVVRLFPEQFQLDRR